MKSILVTFILLSAIAVSAFSQGAIPTIGILTRVVMVESQYGRGTVFSIDVDGKEYWITAKHIVTGAHHPPYGVVASDRMKLKILNPGADGEQWIEREFRILDTVRDVDEVVLVPELPLLENPLASVKTSSASVLLGGECSFLGFPYGGGWRTASADGQSAWMPFTKRCGVSAMIHDPLRVWILDGINNGGFSGGPVLWNTGDNQQIFGVISGYETEPAEVISTASSRSNAAIGNEKEERLKQKEGETDKTNKPKKQMVNVNSGFIIAYDISYAIDAIKNNPIGPLRNKTK